MRTKRRNISVYLVIRVSVKLNKTWTIYFQMYSLKCKTLMKWCSSLYLTVEIDPNNNLWLFMIKRTSPILPNYLWLRKIFLKSGFSTHTHIQSTYEQRSPTKGWNNLENRIVVDWIHVYPSISYGETYSLCDNINTWEMIQSRRLSSHKWDWCPSKGDPSELPCTFCHVEVIARRLP